MKFLDTQIKIKHVLIIAIILCLTAFGPPKLMKMLKSNKESVWAITYFKDKHEVEIRDFNNPRIAMTVSETEGLVFIRNIIAKDSSKIKSFTIK